MLPYSYSYILQTDIKPQLQPQDSIPEMVSSPTDVGIYDGGHQGEKMTWYVDRPTFSCSRSPTIR